MKPYLYNLGQKFDLILEQYADRIAIKYPDGQAYTYSEFNKLANKLANFLLSKKAKVNDVIAIFNDKSVESFALMLACLKIGITYTNLDPNSPEERLNKIIKCCNPSLIFIDPKFKPFSKKIEFPLEHIITLDNPSSPDLQPVLDYEITGNTPAYIMFTSGSTGFPKGAVMSHENVLNLIDWAKETFEISVNDIGTNVNPVYFDNSVFDFYSSLFNGASLVPFDHDQTRNPHALVKQIEEMQCTIWFSVPSMLIYLLTTKAISKGSMPSLRTIIFGGEGFPKPKLEKLFELTSERAKLINVYGPTECTCICSSYEITKKDFNDQTILAPLGPLASNFSFEIIPSDPDKKEIGELCLKGPNVGMGYYNDPERTKASFIQNPFNYQYHELVYKTGDLVRLDENSHFHFMGRVDNQIKHMGYRIELEEIEAGLNAIEGVKESAVVYQPLGPGLGNIIAFVALDSGIESSFVVEEIKKKVPDYMVPRKVVPMDILPKNRNGKIDRVELKKNL